MVQMPRAKQDAPTLSSYLPVRDAFVSGKIDEAEAYRGMKIYQRQQRARRSRLDPAFTDDDIATLVTHWKRLRDRAA